MFLNTFAAIDVGSFETSMKVFEVSKDNGMRQVDYIRRSIDLGTESYTDGVLGFERIEELCNTLREFKKIMVSYEVRDYKAYGTSAVREAKNTGILIDHIEQRTGIHIDVLSNSEQRFLDYKSLALEGERFDKFIEKGTAILDVGGGSIQMSLFDKDKLVSTQNLRIGVLRLQERMNRLGASIRQYDALVDEILDSQLKTYRKLYLKNEKINNLILIDDYISLVLNKSYYGVKVSNIVDSKSIDKYIDQAKELGKKELSGMYGIPEDDIPLLYISALLLKKVMIIAEADKVWAPGVTLCDGIAYEYAEKSGLIALNHDFEKDIIACAKQISKRYMGSDTRSEILEKISLRIFDAMVDISGLNQRDRLLLQISAILHDCGKYVSMLNMADCSYNIIRFTEIIGLSHKERLIVANTVRYNQMSFDYFDETEVKDGLDEKDHMKVAKLTAMLKLSNGLDRSHKMKFENVKISVNGSDLLINIETDKDITLEKGLFQNRADFFREIYNLNPKIKQSRSLG